MKDSIIPKLVKLLAPKYQQDAIYILTLAGAGRQKEFEVLYDNKNYNAACACIDFARRDLVVEGKITRDEFTSFGEYLFEL
jgi:hypothetical protein